LFERVAAQRIARVPQPPGMASNAGYLQRFLLGAVSGVSFFLVSFFLDKQEKVTAPPWHKRHPIIARSAQSNLCQVI